MLELCNISFVLIHLFRRSLQKIRTDRRMDGWMDI